MIKRVMRNTNSNPGLFVIDEEIRADDTEMRNTPPKYVPVFPMSAPNHDERRDDW